MKILFCKVSSMKYYRGVEEYNDIPYNGGKFVEENGYGHEEYNFAPINIEDEECLLGFVETKSNRGRKNELHIENIRGCEAFKNEDYVDGVLVIWCATRYTNRTSIVGWYKDARVYREYQELEDDYNYIYFNIKAKKENCVLIPDNKRNKHIWDAPVPKTHTYGFGQAMILYAKEEKANNYLEKLIKNIEAYDDENVVDMDVEYID